MVIADATEGDWPEIWRFFEAIVGAGETFGYDPGLTADRAREIWMLDPPGRTVVARADDGTVAGSAKIEVLATVPDGFRHPEHGFVGLHMHRRVDQT